MAANATVEAALRARCVDLAHTVMDVTRADGSTVFVPSQDLGILALADGVPRNRAAERYVEGLVGTTLQAIPMLRLLAEGHAAVLHRDDALPLLPGQREVLTLLGIETLSLVPSNPVEGWRMGVTFSHGSLVPVEFETMATVQKLLDSAASTILDLLARLD